MEGLPIYILLDTSGSMYGEPIMSLQNGLQVIIAAFKRNLSTFHRVNFSLISFGDKADLLVPLTDIDEFVMPQLNCYGCTALGDAFNLAATEIAQNALDNEKERILPPAAPPPPPSRRGAFKASLHEGGGTPKA